MAQLRCLAARLFEQPRLGIGGRGMGGIAALLAAKIMVGVAAVLVLVRGRSIATVIAGAGFLLGAEAVHAGPGLDHAESGESTSSRPAAPVAAA